MSRSFGARLLQDVKDLFEPEELQDSEPENQYVTGAAPHPSEGDPAHGIPAYPHPLPGGHEYPGHTVTVPEKVDVPPNKPYYGAGMAHGVKSPEHYDGRIAPKHEERHDQRGENQHPPKLGPYKLEPIPVYITERGAGVHPLEQASYAQKTVVQNADPVPLIERDPNRKRVLLLNESANAVRLRMGPNSDTGALLPANMTNYRDIYTQDQVWAVTDSTATGDAVISVILEYKIGT